MDRLIELQKKRSEIRQKWIDVNREIEELELKNLSLPGKYLYSKERDIYIHVSSASLEPGDSERRLDLYGETLEFGEYFSFWNKDGEVSMPFTGTFGFKSDWEEITEEKWLNVMHEAVESLKKNYL